LNPANFSSKKLRFKCKKYSKRLPDSPNALLWIKN